MLRRVQSGILFTATQYAWLKSEAKRLDVSISEIVRRAIDQVRDAKDA